jgi:hypothetical protein
MARHDCDHPVEDYLPGGGDVWPCRRAVPLRLSAEEEAPVQQVADTEHDGELSAAIRALLAEALAARTIRALQPTNDTDPWASARTGWHGWRNSLAEFPAASALGAVTEQPTDDQE